MRLTDSEQMYKVTSVVLIGIYVYLPTIHHSYIATGLGLDVQKLLKLTAVSKGSKCDIHPLRVFNWDWDC